MGALSKLIEFHRRFIISVTLYAPDCNRVDLNNELLLFYRAVLLYQTLVINNDIHHTTVVAAIQQQSETTAPNGTVPIPRLFS